MTTNYNQDEDCFQQEELRIERDYEAEYEAWLRWKEKEAQKDNTEREDNKRGVVIFQL